MDRSIDQESTAGTLQKILSIAVGLGLLTYMFFFLFQDSEESMLIPVGAVVGLIAYLLTFADIIVGLSFLIVGIGLSPEVSVAGLNDLRLEDFIVPALLLGWLVRVAHTRDSLVPIRIAAPLVVYFVAILLSTVAGLALESTPPRTALLVLSKYLEYFLIFLLVVNNVRRQEQLKALVIFSILVALLSAVLGAGRAFTPDAPGGGRIHGPMGETANIFGGYLILNTSVAVGLLLHAVSSGHRLAASAAVVGLGTFVLFTYSRTSYAAQMAGLAAFGGWKHRRLLVIVLMVALLLPVLAPSDIWARMATIGEIAQGPGPTSWQARTDAWNTALERVAAGSPVFGFGLGSVKLGDVDSEYVRILVDTGLLGLGFFTWLIVRLLRLAHSTYERLDEGGFCKGYSAGYLIAFIALVVHAIAATSFTSIRTMECFMVFTGLLVALSHHAEAWGLARRSAGPI